MLVQHKTYKIELLKSRLTRADNVVEISSLLHVYAQLDSSGPRCFARAPKLNLFPSFWKAKVYIDTVEFP